MITWQATEEIAREITGRIVDYCQPSRIVLFGSLARGEIRDCSDIDLLVIWDTDPALTNRQRRIELRQALGFLPVPLDLLTLTSEEFDRALQDPRSFTARVVREGRTLYERRH